MGWLSLLMTPRDYAARLRQLPADDLVDELAHLSALELEAPHWRTRNMARRRLRLLAAEARRRQA